MSRGMRTPAVMSTLDIIINNEDLTQEDLITLLYQLYKTGYQVGRHTQRRSEKNKILSQQKTGGISST